MLEGDVLDKYNAGKRTRKCQGSGAQFLTIGTWKASLGRLHLRLKGGKAVSLVKKRYIIVEAEGANR